MPRPRSRPEEDAPERDEHSDDGPDEEAQRRRQPSEPQKQRTLRFKGEVSRKVGLSTDDLDKKFEDTKYAHNFWKEMKDLVNSHFGPRCGWETITEKLGEAQVHRNGKGVRGASSIKKWQPCDVRYAKQLLSDSLSQFSPAGPRIAEREGDPNLHVLFCPIGTPKPLEDDHSGVRCIQVIPGDRHCGSMLTSFEDKWGVLEEDMGPGMVFRVGLDRLNNPHSDAPEPTGADAKAVWVHSVVAAILWAKTKNYISADFRTWEWLEDKIRGKTLDQCCEGPDKSLLIFLHLRRPHWREGNSDTRAEINGLNHFLSTETFDRGVRFYPDVKEVLADCDRVWGMRALEAVAKKAPSAYSWRPKVCFGDEPCSMPKDSRVLIRRGSKTGPGATWFGDWNDPKLVKLLPVSCQVSCQEYSPLSPHRKRPGRVQLSSETSEASDETNSTFHQELVPTLETWGEIMVLMVGEKILYTLMVTDECTDDAYRAALTADTCLKDWRKYGGPIVTDDEAEAKEAELHAFCRWWLRNLLGYDEERFESLKVAVRFDIGISEARPDGKFFIHEVTRWTGADFYASHPGTSPPYDYIPRQLGIAFGQKFAPWRKGLNDEDEDEGTVDDFGQDSPARKRKRPITV